MATDSSIASVRISSAGSDFLLVSVLGRTDPAATDFFDGNWLNARLELRAGGFSGAFDTTLRAEAFERFHHELKPLIETRKGNAFFEPMEPSLRINLKGDCRHELDAVCSAFDHAGGNELRFTIAVPADSLGRIIEELAGVLQVFAVVGR